jgi:hypothetical protein
MSEDVGAHFLTNAALEFRGVKSLADRALAQVGDAEFFAPPDAESNSIAINVKHIAGNLHSRWTNFLTTDGEKPNRNRDGEFVIGPDDTRQALMARWDSGWQVLFDALAALGSADVLRSVLIRGEPHTVIQAVHRQLTHYGYHAGQIVFVAKHQRVASWKTLSVARNTSLEFNKIKQEKPARK